MKIDYNLLGNTISTLGDRITNPKGWYYFSAALIVLGLGLMPSLAYLYSHFEMSNWVIMSFVIEIIACIGLIIIAIYDQHTRVHVITAFVMFILFIIGIIIIVIIFTINGEIHNESIVAVILLLILYFGGSLLVKYGIIPIEVHEWAVTIGLMAFYIFICKVITTN